MIRYFFARNRFNIFDGVCLIWLSKLLESGYWFTAIALLIIGPVISASVQSKLDRETA